MRYIVLLWGFVSAVAFSDGVGRIDCYSLDGASIKIRMSYYPHNGEVRNMVLVTERGSIMDINRYLDVRPQMESESDLVLNYRDGVVLIEDGGKGHITHLGGGFTAKQPLSCTRI